MRTIFCIILTLMLSWVTVLVMFAVSPDQFSHHFIYYSGIGLIVSVPVMFVMNFVHVFWVEIAGVIYRSDHRRSEPPAAPNPHLPFGKDR